MLNTYSLSEEPILYLTEQSTITHMPKRFYDNKEAPFTLYTIHTSPGDMMYMFSDGYIDQFGGPEGNKFTSRRFRELLKKIHNMSGPEQEKLLIDTLKTWMGPQEQIDDITILGFRIK